MSDLRQRLRAETRELHDRVDAGFSRFDVTAPRALAGFLAAQSRALAGLAPAPQPAPSEPALARICEGVPALLAEVREALAADLAALEDAGVAAPQAAPQAAPLPAPDPQPSRLATAYVLLGARLGTRVLAARWRQATEAPVLAAGAFFTLPGRGGDWRALCAGLSAMPADGHEAAAHLAGARALFHRFARTADDARPPPGQPAHAARPGPRPLAESLRP